MRFALFLLTFVGLLSAGHVYLYRRFVRDLTKDERLRRFAIAAFSLLGVGIVVSRFVWRHLPPLWGKVFSFTLWLWLGFALYALLVFLVVDAAALGLWSWRRLRAQGRPDTSPERRRFLATVAAGTASSVSASVVGYGYWRAYVAAPRILEVPLTLPNWPKALDGFSIVQLTDVHVGSIIQRRFIDEVVGRVNGLRPDLVAITGDLVDGSPEDLGHAVSGLQRLQSRFGTYFVHGNHEYYSGDERWTRALEGMDLHVLRNRFVRVGDGGASFDLVGVDDWMGDRSSARLYDLARAVQGRDPERAAVLLAHQPEGFDQAVSRGIGLQLSGHTHGGQLFPMTQLVKLRWPRPVGLWSERGHHLYVSRGTGFWGPPLRVGSPPEIIRFSLHG